MTKRRSMDVINDARDMELQLNWILFKQEQEKLLWGDGPLPLTWRPGDPLYKTPKVINIYSIIGGWRPIVIGGSWPRPMLEEMIDDCDDDWHVDIGGTIEDDFDCWVPICRDCETSWNPLADGFLCFACGKDYTPKPHPMSPKIKRVAGPPNWIVSTTTGVRGQTARHTILDEGTPNEQILNEVGEWVPTGRISSEGFVVEELGEGPISFADLNLPAVRHSFEFEFDIETFEPPQINPAFSSIRAAAEQAAVPLSQTMTELIDAFSAGLDVPRQYLVTPRRAGRSQLMEALRNLPGNPHLRMSMNSSSSRRRYEDTRTAHECAQDMMGQTNRSYPGSEPITQQRRRRNL